MPFVQVLALSAAVTVLAPVPAHALELEASLQEFAASGVEAKSKAMARGVETAFENFIRSSVASSNHEKAREVIRRNEARLVESVFVEDEAIGPGSYEARLRFVVREGVFRQLFAQAGIPYVTEDAPPVLVVPYEREGEALDIDPDGAWLAAWEASKSKTGRAPVIIPQPPFESDVFDQVTLAMPFEEQAFYLGIRYGVRSIVFAILEKGEAPWHLRLTGEDAIGVIEHSIEIDALRGAPGAGMERAVRDAIILLDDRWKDAAAQPRAAMQDIRHSVRVPLLHGVEEWPGVERLIRQAEGVRRLDLTHLAQSHAEADLFVSGGTDGLVRALEKDFVVLHAEDGVLVLRPYIQ